jgi:hypothetical protein
LAGRRPANDPDEFANDVGARAAGGTAQQIFHRRADLRLGIGVAGKIQLDLI